ncbi:MAG: bifunctional riboflavin kinase/FAD synthetase [Polyangiaceae bacterium]
MQKPAPHGRLVAIGNFDGVHLGHQAVLSDAATDAASRGLRAIVLTFHPHPAAVIGRGAPPLLTPLPRKIELIGHVQPEVGVAVEPFDLDFAAQTPDAFAEEVLVRRLQARVVVVGRNFRFGKARAGDYDVLSRLGARLGFETRSHALVGDDRGTFSSTRAREAIASGDLDAARAILGRPHALSGVVVRGDQRGRTIGFPTANMGDVVEALPPFGVYAVAVDRVTGDDPETGASRAEQLGAGVANIGVRPTVKVDAPPSVEVHLFDFDADLYDARIRVHLLARLRGEQRFSGLDALRAQIAKDAAAAREITARLQRPALAAPWW